MQRRHPSVPGQHLSRPLDVCQTKACTLGHSTRVNREAPFTQTLEVCFSLLFRLCPGGGSLPRTVFPFVTHLWDPQMQTLLATRARHPKGVPWAAVIETTAPDVQTGTSDLCKPPTRSWLSAAWQRESMKTVHTDSTCLLRSVKRITVRPQMYVYLEACLLGHSNEDKLIGLFHGKTGHFCFLPIAMPWGGGGGQLKTLYYVLVGPPRINPTGQQS